MTKPMHIAIAISIALAATTLLACDPDGGQDELTRAADPSQLETLEQPPSAPLAADDSLEARLLVLQPVKTRAGWLRFTDPLIYEAGALPVLLARLDAGEDSPAVRAAVAEALGRTGADYAAEVSARIAGEQDARVRELLVGSLGRRAPGEGAHAGLSLGLTDEDAAVRGAAVRALADRLDGAEFSAELLARLDDSETGVRADAARTLGVLGVSEAAPELRALLEHADAELRLNSLRALSRIDAGASQLDLGRLAGDEDARVARLARQLM